MSECRTGLALGYGCRVCDGLGPEVASRRAGSGRRTSIWEFDTKLNFNATEWVQLLLPVACNPIKREALGLSFRPGFTSFDGPG